MPNFVWTAKTKTGASVVRQIKAATIEESKVALLSEGCTDLVLKEDDVFAATLEGFDERASVFGEEIVPTPENRIKARNKLNRGFIASFVGDYGLLLVALLVVGWAFRYQEFRSAVVMTVFVAVVSTFVLWVRLPLIYYNRINKAKEWHRWPQVLKLVERSEFIRRFHFIKIPVTELARCRAQALTGMGRLSEALYVFQFTENQPGMPGWLYKSHLAGLYRITKQGDRVIELMREAIALNPTPVLFIDLAEALLRFKRDTAQAREALAEAERSTLTDYAMPFLHRCRGIMAYLEGDLTLAKNELTASLEILEATRKQPFREGTIALVKAHLCCTHAKMGGLDAARKLFGQSKDFLIAAGEAEMLAECKSVLTQQPSQS